MKADTITKDYISDMTVFADVFNYYIYDGQQVILPEQLKQCDSTEIALPYGTDGSVVPVQKFRDSQKLCTAMTDGKLEYVIYGAEAQAEIHNAMAVRNNLYDALEYAGQVNEAAKSHRRAMKAEKEKLERGEEISDKDKIEVSSKEFLSGFWEGDKLIPSVTVTIYFGAETWSGPMSLSEMMEVKDSRVLACVNDYKLHLIAPAGMSDEEIMKFHSSLREVLFFIKYSKDKENLDRILKENEERFKEVERRAVDVIEVITHCGLKYEESERSIDMCQAIQEIRTEEHRKGELKGELKKAKETANNLYEMGLDVDKIAKAVGYAAEMVRGWLPANAQ